MTATHKRIYSLAHLESLPTLAQGQTDDLKIETPTTRVWLSRCTVEDGEPYNNKVTVEILKEGYVGVKRETYEKYGRRGHWETPHWVTDYTYEAKYTRIVK